MATVIDRYGVYWVNLDPVGAATPVRIVPAVVVSDAAMNRTLDTVVVCPVTSRLHPRWPFRVTVAVNQTPGEVAVDQLRTVDRSRLGEKVVQLPRAKAEEVRHVITLMYGVLS